ncbi:MAG TPA: FHA domain-containing protein [Burkholderiaceae bacterium]|nr:FHA domain-containing protein [Burkholderiaceae bacterium]
MQATQPDLDIVLKPLSRPELGEIRIAGGMFAVGRTEPPFASYEHGILEMLSRRHARIFCEDGAVYLADLDSRNGTTVNRSAVVQSPCRLTDGDEVCFGGVLSYRVEIAPRAGELRHTADGFSLTLTPASSGTDLQPLVITRFPFLVSKSDAAFSRYQQEHGRQLSFLSRRHAHIFQKDGGAWIEDLDSSNGTFVDGLRLQEHAVPLEDGMLLAFGGDHFTYRVSIAKALGTAPTDPGTRAPETQRAERAAASTEPAAVDKTTFVVAPTSFLDIFCVDEKTGENVEATNGPPSPGASTKENAKRKPRGRTATLWSELVTVLTSAGQEGERRSGWKVALIAALLGAAALALYLWGAPERELKDAFAHGDYAKAAALANQQLEERADDTDLKALATEAALKANVPVWLEKWQARDFDGAKAQLDRLSQLGIRNPDLRPLVGELEWLGNLERLVSARGGPDAPIRIYVDEDGIAALIARWNDNTGEHQRALARIASHVPQFAAPYAEALTHLRKLQSDATVYLTAIERLKTSIATELNRDNPQALVAVLKETAEKYPGLGGLDGLRQDLARYIEIKDEARTRRSGRLFALLLNARFTTPPFQEAFRAMAAGRQLPGEELIRQYAAATQPWKEGHASESLAGLQKIAAGPWADAVAGELARRQAVVAQFAALQQARASSGYAEQLLAFRASLAPDEDVYFVRTTQADMESQRDQALARAQESMSRARALWQDYRNNGVIEAAQRVETTISNTFRTRARLLSEARRQAQLATQIYAQMKVAAPAPWSTIHDEIRVEAEQQRNALLELRNVLAPELLKSKLALLGEAGDGPR